MNAAEDQPDLVPAAGGDTLKPQMVLLLPKRKRTQWEKQNSKMMVPVRAKMRLKLPKMMPPPVPLLAKMRLKPPKMLPPLVPLLPRSPPRHRRCGCSFHGHPCD